MFCFCNLCGVFIMPTPCGLCNECYKISRLIKVSSSNRCLQILEKNIINIENTDKKTFNGVHQEILDKFQNTKKS